MSARPERLEWAALAAVLVALLAFGLTRIACVDVPWHLATARLAFETGHWPTSNTFSYTYPDYPLYQQYPLFQGMLYAAHRLGGWSALSLFLCVSWVVVFLLFLRWAGPLRCAAALHLPWMVGMVALQRRLVLRPDVLTMVWLACTLLVIDAYRQGRRHWIPALPLIQLAWANSHQLFPLGLVAQALLLAHIAIARRGWLGADRSDAGLSLTPPAIAFTASLAACLGTPIGTGVLGVLSHTTGSLAQHRHHVQEFAFIWQNPVELALAALCAVPAVWALWRQRRRWVPLEIGIWLLSLALVLSATRGLVFFGPISIAIFQRTWRREGKPVGWMMASTSRSLVRVLAAAATLLVAGTVVYKRWVDPPLILGGTQPGLGRSLGDWPDEGIRFLREAPPPGLMMNMPWSLANATLWFTPELRPFVDPRFESYPRTFLLEAIASYDDDGTLARLIAEYRPSWIFAEHCSDAIRARLGTLMGSGAWALAHADARTVVLVRPTPETEGYLARHRLDALPPAPADLLPRPAALRRQQQECWQRLRAALPPSPHRPK